MRSRATVGGDGGASSVSTCECRFASAQPNFPVLDSDTAARIPIRRARDSTKERMIQMNSECFSELKKKTKLSHLIELQTARQRFDVESPVVDVSSCGDVSPIAVCANGRDDACSVVGVERPNFANRSISFVGRFEPADASAGLPAIVPARSDTSGSDVRRIGSLMIAARAGELDNGSVVCVGAGDDETEEDDESVVARFAFSYASSSSLELVVVTDDVGDEPLSDNDSDSSKSSCDSQVPGVVIGTSRLPFSSTSTT